jgi:hypothetical protein
MEQIVAVQSKPQPKPQSKPGTLPLEEATPASLQEDPHWALAQRVIAGPNFARSPLLTKFLLFVVAESLEGRGDEITEHLIGVHVFDRPADYRTLEDNIVRSYARQLRKRLAEHFADQGSSEPVRIDIPVGGYVPVFVPVAEDAGRETAPKLPIAQLVQVSAPSPAPAVAERAPSRRWNSRTAAIALAVAIHSVALVTATWFLATYEAKRSAPAPPVSEEPAGILWAQIFGGTMNCYIVPSDAGFNLLEDLSHRPVPLAEYVSGSYQELPLAGVDAHSAADLRSQHLTPYVDLQIVALLARLAEVHPQHVSLRFPRDLRLDDLKNSNAVIIGSVGSNPWAAIAESSANFRIVDRPGMNGAQIINLKPQAGELPTYSSHWNEPAHDTYALIDFLPNLSGSGHLLVLEGLDVAGTQAAAEMLLYPSAIDPILKLATRPDKSLRNFEVLLRSTSIQSNATGTQVIASRIY